MSEMVELSADEITELQKTVNFLSEIQKRIITADDWIGSVAGIAAGQAISGILYLVANNPLDLTIDDVGDRRIKKLCPHCGATLPMWNTCPCWKREES